MDVHLPKRWYHIAMNAVSPTPQLSKSLQIDDTLVLSDCLWNDDHKGQGFLSWSQVMTASISLKQKMVSGLFKSRTPKHKLQSQIPKSLFFKRTHSCRVMGGE